VSQALVGKDGPGTIRDPNTIVNAYSALVADAAVNTSSVTVNNIAELATNLGTDGGLQPLAVGDLLLIIQMRGATMDPNDPNNATWGSVSAANLGNAGNYELAGVAGISGNVITLGCALKKSYSGATPTDAGVTVTKAQVIRVAQYTTLTINSGASIIARPWNGAVGGVVVVHASDTLQLNGSINVTGQGFHGGATHAGANLVVDADQPTYRSNDGTLGAEKGESIAGWPNHDPLSIFPYPYGRGAPANGGGGGNWHNAAGGGGANAAASGESSDAGGANAWTGQGVMLSSVTGASAWLLDPGYALSGGPGGGRGGYTYSSLNRDALTIAPGFTGVGNWGGNLRRERGGLGGRPFTSSPTGRLFLGGGGGAGDGNNTFPGAGGNGGGLVFVIAGTVAGPGRISADGAPGGTANSAGSASGDAAGGGGGGGTVVVHAASLSGIAVEANGGVGGSQINLNSAVEAEGPGGGGGGGYIALSGGAPASVSASGGLGGTTNPSAGVTSPLAEFPSNGATAGNAGVTDGDASSILFCTDAVLPVTTIVTHPNNPTNVNRGAFTFASNGGVPPTDAAVSTDGTVTFECRLDGGSYTPCPAAYTTPLPALADGSHTLYVRATDLSGYVGDPVTYTWTVDTIAPDTTIVTSPPNPSDSSTAHFAFTSSESGEEIITFQCKLDAAAAFAACPADYTIDGLSDGSHTLQVQAQDAAGNVDATPASYTWTVHALGLDGGATDAEPQEAGAEAAVPDAAAIDGPGTVVLLDASPGLDSADGPGTVVLLDASPGADALATSTDAVAIGADGPGTVVFLDASADVAVVLDLAADGAPTGGNDVPPIGTLDAGKDALAADAVGLLDAIIVGGGDANAQDAVVLLDAGSSDAVAVPDQAVLPPDAEMAVDAPISIVQSPDAAQTNNSFEVMGSGFCAIAPLHDSAPGLFSFFLVAAFGLLLRRRRR
jgi:hypothetical protein